MNKKVLKIGAIALVGVGLATGISVIIANLVKSGLKDQDNTLPDTFAATPSDKNSWEYWTDTEYDDGEVLTLDWYVDASGWAPTANTGIVRQKIMEKTGCYINFQTPGPGDNGAKMTTMISGGQLPDLVSVECSSAYVTELPYNKYIYSITDMATRWAPKMLSSYSKEVQDMYAFSDGKLYGLPHLYYTDEDLEAYENQNGYLISNGGFLARKDCLDWYLEKYPTADPTSPSGFIKMCKAVKNDCPYYTTADNYSMVQLSAFSTNTDNESLKWLAQYFATPREDSEGNLTKYYEEENYLEALSFLNELYLEGLVTDSAFSDTSTAVGSNIQNGRPFVTMVTPQNYMSAYSTWNYNNPQKAYESVVITNSNGDAPVLQNLSGNGYLYTMVSTNCKRPDRVIKLLDYLTSYEGQMLLLFGVEGQTYNYTVQPGETVDGVTYKYGKIEYTGEVSDFLATGGSTASKYGFIFDIVSNRLLNHMVSPNNFSLYNYKSYCVFNLKAPLTPYCYDPKLFSGYRNPLDVKYKEISNMDTKISNYWRQQLPGIVSAESLDELEYLYNQAISKIKSYGYYDVWEFDNKYFKEQKAKAGVTYAWPAAAEDYVGAEVKIKGYPEYCVDIPPELKLS